MQGEASCMDSSEGVLAEDTEVEAARKRHDKDVSTCQQTYEVVLRGFVPKLYNARTMDETLLRPFRYCDTSWRDGAAALRQELIDISHRWTELGLPGQCPYQLTPEELREHEKHFEDFETVHKKLFGEFLEAIKESGGSEERARALWPFGDFNNSH